MNLGQLAANPVILTLANLTGLCFVSVYLNISIFDLNLFKPVFIDADYLSCFVAGKDCYCFPI